MALNLDSLVVDSSGRASFSGLSTGIDFVGAVDAIIAAKRIPAVTLETRITGNEEEIAALGIAGTPSLLVGERLVSGTVSLKTLHRNIAQARAS